MPCLVVGGGWLPRWCQLSVNMSKASTARSQLNDQHEYLLPKELPLGTLMGQAVARPLELWSPS